MKELEIKFENGIFHWKYAKKDTWYIIKNIPTKKRK